jgi:hypothetical protein
MAKRWHKFALPVIRTKAFQETWFDFAHAWKSVKYPRGDGPMNEIYAKAKNSKFPEVAGNYDQHQMRVLVALCRELQRAAGPDPFYLSARTAGTLLEVDHTTAWRWLSVLQINKVIEEVEKGSQKTGKASRYRYLATE